MLRRAGKALEKDYRALVEGRIRQGVEEELGARIRWGLVLGGERFARKVRGRIQVQREHQGQEALSRRRSFEEIVRMVERIKHESWAAFRNRYGDWGRDLVLWAARGYGGMTLGEAGKKAGQVDYTAVAMAVRRLGYRARKDRELRAAMKHVALECAK